MLITLIKMTQDNTSCAVRERGALSAFFDVLSGVKQGDPLSPLLFNLALQGAMGHLHEQQERPELLINPVILAFADDLAIVAKSRDELRAITEKIRDGAARFGLELSPKTEYMVILRDPARPELGQSLPVGAASFRRVESFKYLGCVVSQDNSLDKEIRARVLAGMRAYYALTPLFRSKRVSNNLKIRVYAGVIRPSILYGCET